MRKVLLTLMLATLGLCPLIGQESDWFLNKPIKDVRFTGIERVSKTELEGIIKPFIGKPFTEAVLADMQRRLYALEYFDYLAPDAIPVDDSKQAVIISFTVKERPTIEDIVFEGNTAVRSGDILTEVTEKIGTTVSKSKISADEENIRKYYLKNGFSAVKVSSRLDPGTAKNTKKLVFVVSEGLKSTIRKIQFSGNQFASESTLKGLLKNSEQSLFNAGTYLEENLELDRQAIIKYYRDNGYVDMKIIDVKKTEETVEADKRSYLTIVFYLDEGQQWNFGGMNVSGNEIFSTDKLLALVHSKKGSVINYTKVQADYQAIADQYYKNGYINNSISLDEKRDTTNRTISYTVNIVERGRAYVENIILRGNTKTKPETILRELPFETGDVFSADRIREGILNLTNKRYFSNIVPETPAGSAPGLYDLILNLTEANTIDLRLGFSVSGSTDFPLSGFVRWGDTNFLGNGQDISAELNIGPTEQKITFSFTDPWLFGPNWSGGVNLSFDRSILTGIPQDILGPVFSGTDSSTGLPNGVPDPYTGNYVFSHDTTYTFPNSSKTQMFYAGNKFPGTPSADEINKYGLVTDYDYAGGVTSIPSEYTMQYTNWAISLGLNTGMTIRTPIGRFGWSGYGSVGLNLIQYDQSLYRPWSQTLRDNYNQFLFVNRLGASVSLDGRDIVFDPSSGGYLSQSISLTGGFLLGSRDYIRTDSTLQAYLTLWDLPVFETWNWKGVLAFNSTLSVLFPQFWVPPGAPSTFVADDNFLYTNPLTVARGWSERTNGVALWNNWLELRMPIVPQVLSLDFYAEAVHLTSNRSTIFSFNQTGNEDWMMGIGAGLRVTNPSLPIRLYLAKRFALDEGGQITWQRGNLFSTSDPNSGLDLVFTFSLF